ncbi:glycosyltransferase [Corynebacterium casei]|uniref:glycosyltransferase n=1 Tax=Corynebacterium casei TaxID=160386 RepID=UPI003FD41934
MDPSLFIGTTRFSLFVPGSKNWNLSSRHASEDEYMRALYSRERLEARLDIFSRWSVPQLAEASKNYNVKHYVQCSGSLPVHYQNELRKLTEKYDFLELFISDSEVEHSALIGRSALAWAKDQSKRTSFAWYRIDDDDIIGSRYFDMAHNYVEERFEGMVLSFGRGFTVVYDGGHLWNLREFYHSKTSAGQMYICGIDPETGVLVEPPRENHAQIDRWAPTIVDSRVPNFVTTRHSLQDGHLKGTSANSLSRILEDQKRLPVARPSGVFAEVFPKLLEEFRSSSVPMIAEDQQDSGNPILVSREKSNFDLGMNREASELFIEVGMKNFVDSGKLFIGLEFEKSIPKELSDSVYGWKDFGTSTLVRGYPASKRIRKYIYLSKDLMEFAPRLSIWHSADLANSRVSLLELSLRQ